MNNKPKGIILIILSALFFALMASTVKYLHHIPVAEKIFFRNIFGLVISILIITKKKKSFLGNNKKFLFLRSLFGLLGVAANFYALSIMPLVDAVILNKMSPFFVLILSAIFLKEKLTKGKVIALALAVTGAAFVVKPEFGMTMVPALIALSSALFAGSAYTIIRYLKDYDTPETIVLYFTFFSTIAMIPFMVMGEFVIPTLSETIGLICLGVFATTAQFLMTNAYRFAPAGELSIYTYFNILFSTILGFILWLEIPDVLSVLGAFLILSAGFITYYLNKTKAMIKEKE